jgi:hypothetical protein
MEAMETRAGLKRRIWLCRLMAILIAIVWSVLFAWSRHARLRGWSLAVDALVLPVVAAYLALATRIIRAQDLLKALDAHRS